MTAEEVELVRENQNIDLRIDVLVKMIDRRFAALGIDAGSAKPAKKDKDIEWGEVKGTRLQLFTDIRDLLQKSVDDIDDVAMHNDVGLAENKMSGPLFPKAVRSLAAAAERFLSPLNKNLESANDEVLKGVLEKSIELCGSIIEAQKRLPPDQPKRKKS